MSMICLHLLEIAQNHLVLQQCHTECHTVLAMLYVLFCMRESGHFARQRKMLGYT